MRLERVATRGGKRRKNVGCVERERHGSIMYGKGV